MPRSQRYRRPFRPLDSIASMIAAAGLMALAGCGTSDPTGSGTGDAGGLRLGAFVSDRNNTPGNTDLYLWDYDQLALRTAVIVRTSLPTAIRRFERRTVHRVPGRPRGAWLNSDMFDRVQRYVIDLTGSTTGSTRPSRCSKGDASSCASSGIAAPSAF